MTTSRKRTFRKQISRNQLVPQIAPRRIATLKRVMTAELSLEHNLQAPPVAGQKNAGADPVVVVTGVLRTRHLGPLEFGLKIPVICPRIQRWLLRGEVLLQNPSPLKWSYQSGSPKAEPMLRPLLELWCRVQKLAILDQHHPPPLLR